MAEGHRPSVQEIVVYLGVRPSTIYIWVHMKRIPLHRFGSLLRFRTSVVDK